MITAKKSFVVRDSETGELKSYVGGETFNIMTRDEEDPDWEYIDEEAEQKLIEAGLAERDPKKALVRVRLYLDENTIYSDYYVSYCRTIIHFPLFSTSLKFFIKEKVTGFIQPSFSEEIDPDWAELYWTPPEGKKFGGWCADLSNPEATMNNQFVPDYDIVLYALWVDA